MLTFSSKIATFLFLIVWFFLKGFVFLCFNEVRQHHKIKYCLICTLTDILRTFYTISQRVFKNIYERCPKSFGLIQVFLLPHETADMLVTETHGGCSMRKHHDLVLCCHANRHLYSILYLWSPSNDWHLYMLLLTFYLTTKNLIDSFNMNSNVFWSAPRLDIQIQLNLQRICIWVTKLYLSKW